MPGTGNEDDTNIKQNASYQHCELSAILSARDRHRSVNIALTTPAASSEQPKESLHRFAELEAK